jgi:L-asparagine transporter-like permease
VGRWAGFATRLTYWFAETLAIGAQLTAVGVYFGFWFPEVPAFLFMAGAALVAISVNALHVGRFGSLESALSMVKVAAIVGFVVAGGALVFGVGRGRRSALSNLTGEGGLFPNGATGVWLAFTLVITSYLGMETVAVTAGEADRPEKTVSRALLGTAAALTVLYVLSMGVIVTMSSWRAISETSGTLTGSPFVAAFESIGVPYASSLMNFVVITAAFTAVMSHLYICTRMLFSLSRAGYVPRAVGAVDRRCPFAPSRLGGGMVIALALLPRGRQVFLPMYGTAVAALRDLADLRHSAASVSSRAARGAPGAGAAPSPPGCRRNRPHPRDPRGDALGCRSRMDRSHVSGLARSHSRRLSGAFCRRAGSWERLVNE